MKSVNKNNNWNAHKNLLARLTFKQIFNTFKLLNLHIWIYLLTIENSSMPLAFPSASHARLSFSINEVRLKVLQFFLERSWDMYIWKESKCMKAVMWHVLHVIQNNLMLEAQKKLFASPSFKNMVKLNRYGHEICRIDKW